MQVHRVSYGLLCGEDLESSCLGLLRVTIFRNLGVRGCRCIEAAWDCSLQAEAKASAAGQSKRCGTPTL